MEIKSHCFNLDGRKDFINLYFLGDIHEGNVNHAVDEFKEAVKIIREDPKGYWIGMGDYIDAVTYTDRKRFNPVTIDPIYRVKDLTDLPGLQIENFFNKVKSIKDKCICLMIGNHEETVIKYYHNDIYKKLHHLFDNKPAKLGYVGFLNLSFIEAKQHRFSVSVGLNHGIGGGGFREGYPVNKLHDVFRSFEADLCVMGHVHHLVEDSRKLNTPDNNSKLKKVYRHWGCSGCFLKTYNQGSANYFEANGRYEPDIGMLKATISMRGDRVKHIHLQKIKLG